MSSNEYNIRLIIFFLVCILGIILISFETIKVIQYKNWARDIDKAVVIIRSISMLCILIISFFFFFSYIYNEKTLEGTVTTIKEKGTIAWRFINDYEIVISHNNEEVKISTGIFNSRRFIKSVSNIQEGDKIKIKYNFWKDFYYYEIIHDN